MTKSGWVRILTVTEWVGEDSDSDKEWVGEDSDSDKEWVGEDSDNGMNGVGEDSDSNKEWVGEDSDNGMNGVSEVSDSDMNESVRIMIVKRFSVRKSLRISTRCINYTCCCHVMIVRSNTD